MSLEEKQNPPKIRLEILLDRGTEQLLPEGFYELSNPGIWIEDRGADVLVKCYPCEPERLLQLLRLSGIIPKDIRFCEEEDHDYAALTRKYFRPIRIEDISIVPPWSKKRKGPRIIIEPGMAFGTGRHESTRLMIRLMRGMNLAGKKVLDLGCGSAILALYAEMLGADFILAVDNDPDAVLSARKNLALNNARGVSLACTSLDNVRGRFDLILANLDIRTFTAFSQHVAGLLNNNGLLVVSGILGRDERKLLSLFLGFSCLQRERMNAWRGFLFARTPGQS